MSGILEKNQGVMNPAQRYRFKNITGEDFTSYWNKNPITVKAGESVTVPEYLADKMTDELVNKIMIDEVKQNEINYYKNNPNTAPNFYRAPYSFGVPAVRKVWEDKIITKLPMEEGTTEAQLLRLQIQEEITKDLKAEPSTEPVKVPVSTVGNFSDNSLEEFAEIKTPNSKPKKK